MSETRCRHVCSCGAILICGDADKCGAGAFWRCFACELDHYDDYLNRRLQEHDEFTAHTHTPPQEKTHEGL